MHGHAATTHSAPISCAARTERTTAIGTGWNNWVLEILCFAIDGNRIRVGANLKSVPANHV